MKPMTEKKKMDDTIASYKRTLKRIKICSSNSADGEVMSRKARW